MLCVHVDICRSLGTYLNKMPDFYNFLFRSNRYNLLSFSDPSSSSSRSASNPGTGSKNNPTSTNDHGGHQNHIHGKKIILIREYPTLSDPARKARFHDILWKMLSHSPGGSVGPASFVVIFCVTEQHESQSNQLRQTFDAKLLNHVLVGQIAMNPVNNTLLRKCLKNICASQRLHVDKAYLDSVVLSAAGPFPPPPLLHTVSLSLSLSLS